MPLDTDGYGAQPPASTGTTTTLAAPPTPRGDRPLPTTGSDLGLLWIALAVLMVGAAVVIVARRIFRDPFGQVERDRQREWDRMARLARSTRASGSGTDFKELP
jgi:hypothetical protein